MFRAFKRLFIWLGLMAEQATETDAINQAVIERGIRDSKAKADKAHYANGQLAGQISLLRDQTKRQERQREELQGLLQAAAAANDEANGAHYAEELFVEEGFRNGDPKFTIGMCVEALVRVVRLIVAIGVHTGAMTVDDILEELGPLVQEVRTDPAEPPVRHPAELALSDSERSLLGQLDDTPTSVDELIGRTGLTVSQVMATLSVLEMKRLVRRQPGHRFVRA